MIKAILKAMIVLGGLGSGVAAHATLYTATGTLLANYYTMKKTDADFQGHCCSDYFPNMVGSTLYHGLPTLSSAYMNNPADPVIHDLGPHNTINWWGRYADVSNNSHLSYDGSGYTTHLPVSMDDIYAPHDSGHNDNNSFQTAVFMGWFRTTGPSTVLDFSVRADDDAFVYIDNNIVDQMGGVHPEPSVAELGTTTVGAGWHKLSIYYADRHTVDASLDFIMQSSARNLCLIPTVPEPETWAMLGLGMGALGYLALRRRQQSDTRGERDTRFSAM